MTIEAEGCLVVNSIEDAIKLAYEAGENEPFVIGGGFRFTNMLLRTIWWTEYISQEYIQKSMAILFLTT